MKSTNLIITALFTSLVIFIVYFNSLSNKYYNRLEKMDSFSEVQDVLQNADKNSLILFDVDDTLIIPSAVFMRTDTVIKHQEELLPIIENIFGSVEQFMKEYILYFMSTDMPTITEPQIVNIIKSLQDKGIKVLALTNCSTGYKNDVIASFPEWRYTKLKSVGIDFNAVNIPDTTFTQLNQKDDGYPMLYKGILLTNHESKGVVLDAFLDYTNLKPSEIIFFDDNKDRITEVEQAARARNIPFIGYQYSGAKNVPGEFNIDVARLQLQYLKDNKVWLNDSEALAMLKKDYK